MVLAFYMVFDKIQTKLRDTEAMEDGDSTVSPWMCNNEERGERIARSFLIPNRSGELNQEQEEELLAQMEEDAGCGNQTTLLLVT